MGYIIIIGLFIIYGIYILEGSFATWSDMNYVKHLEDMGVFVDKNGREI